MPADDIAAATAAPAPAAAPAPRSDFWLFLVGQALSRLGSSFTAFALPLLVYLETGSALDLGIATAATFVPYLLFGLVLGAWVDRSNRKRLMVATDLGRAAVVATIPLVAALGILSAWWIYAVAFVSSTLTIAFEACEFAAMPNLARGADLTALNGRVQSSYSIAAVVGPLVAGMLVNLVSPPTVILIDTVTFLISAWTIALIRTRFNAGAPGSPPGGVLDDVRAGLRYVWQQPALRNISIMMAMVNFLAITTNAQLVLFATRQLRASSTEIAWLYAAESLGMGVLALVVAPLRRRLSFAQVALGALAVFGAVIVVFALNTSYPLALVLWALGGGTSIMFNVAASSLRQKIVPDDMLGRVMTIASVLAWSAIPVGSLVGGAVIQRTGDVVLTYAGIGALVFALPVGFSFSSAWKTLPEETRS
jgi:MFS family permease